MNNRSDSTFVGSILWRALAFAILLLAIGLAVPTPAQAGDHSKYADIVDTNPNPVPHGPTPEDLEYIQELQDQRAAGALEVSIMAAPTGTVWTPGEYEEIKGVFVPWEPGSYLALLTEFAVGVTTDASGSLAYVIVSGASQEASATTTLAGAGADMSRVRFIYYNLDTVWIRDYGPRYNVVDGKPGIIDHTYNRPRAQDNAFPDFVDNQPVPFLQDEPVYLMDLTHGGGNFLAFSNGDAFMSSLIEEENTDKTTAEITTIVEDHFNVNLHIFPRLSANVDATGHIDMWMMPLSDDAVLISEFPTSHPGSKTITDNAATYMAGQGYTVYRTPAYNSTGESSTGGTHYTYTNAAIVNDRVYIPEYGGTHVTDDATALAVYQSALPGREIVQVDTASIITAAGAIHCVMKHVYTSCSATSATISGTILDGGSSPVEGALVTADNGGGIGSTDATGYYEFCVPNGWSGTVTPTMSGTTFAPASRSYTNVTSDMPGEDYTAEGPVIALGPDDFELGFGNWSNITGDIFDWTRNSGSTTSSGTGPSGDHTTGSGYYVYIETSSPRVAGDTAILESACIDLTDATSANLNFWRHMYGASMGSLDVEVASSTGDSCASLGAFGNVYSLSGDQGDQWVEDNVSLDSYVGNSIRIRMIGTRGSSYTGDLALDDLVVTKAVSSAAVCGNDIVETGEDCDDGNTDPGDCCSATCSYEVAGSLCGNPGDGVCDLQDTCNGSGVCTDNVEPPTTVCRADAGECDVAELCDGAGACPVDGFEVAGTLCGNPGDGVCDLQDTCNGSGACTDNVEPPTTVCRADAGECDVAELCDGAGACPVDGFEVAGTLCGNPGDGVCDLQDTCNGSGVCTDNVEPPTTVCRADAGACDVAELCDGAGSCPADVVLDGVSCNDNNVCNGTDMCEAGVCVHTNPLDCNDSEVCTTDYCSPILGCQYVNNTLSCEDGNACTSGDKCSGGTCGSGLPMDCDDENSCTADSCDEIAGCINEVIPGCTAVPTTPEWGLPLLAGLLLAAGALLVRERRRAAA